VLVGPPLGVQARPARLHRARWEGRQLVPRTTIAKETGLALRGVWRATVDLVGLGVLDFERGGNGTPSRYTVRPSILASLTDNEITSCKSGKRESQTRNRRVSADTQPTRVSQDQTRNGRGPDTQREGTRHATVAKPLIIGTAHEQPLEQQLLSAAPAAVRVQPVLELLHPDEKKASNYQRVVDGFFVAFERATGRKWLTPITRGDGAQVKRALATGLPVDEILTIIARALADDFVGGKTPDLASVLSARNLNAFRGVARASGPMKQPAVANGWWEKKLAREARGES